jgi:hypothetical protein
MIAGQADVRAGAREGKRAGQAGIGQSRARGQGRLGQGAPRPCEGRRGQRRAHRSARQACELGADRAPQAPAAHKGALPRSMALGRTAPGRTAGADKARGAPRQGARARHPHRTRARAREAPGQARGRAPGQSLLDKREGAPGRTRARTTRTRAGDGRRKRTRAGASRRPP